MECCEQQIKKKLFLVLFCLFSFIILISHSIILFELYLIWFV